MAKKANLKAQVVKPDITTQDPPITAVPLVAVISDTHFGGFTSLCPEQVELDDGGRYYASAVQLKLLEWWDAYWKEVFDRAQGRKLIVIHLGDIVDGNVKHRGQGLTNPAVQEAIAIAMLKPIRDRADKFFITRGTEAHVGDSAEAEVRIAKALEADACEWELGLRVGSVLYDLSHHGRGSSRPWGSAGATQAWEVIADCHMFGVEVPRFILRGHRHILDDSGERVPGTRFICLPAWQLRNAHGHKVASTRRSDIGGIIIEGENVTVRRYSAPLGRSIIKVD